MTETVPVHEGLFVERPDGARLIGGSCAACGRHHFPRLTSCPYCSAADCVEKLLGDRGSLFLYTVVVNRPPGYRGELPFGFGVVELPEGIRLITRITEARLDRLRLGMPMRLVVAPLHVDDEGRHVVSYAFAPEASRVD
jgi:uncharacterized OB-fold protein